MCHSLISVEKVSLLCKPGLRNLGVLQGVGDNAEKRLFRQVRVKYM
jgi:hypothetical protein